MSTDKERQSGHADKIRFERSLMDATGQSREQVRAKLVLLDKVAQVMLRRQEAQPVAAPRTPAEVVKTAVKMAEQKFEPQPLWPAGGDGGGGGRRGGATAVLGVNVNGVRSSITVLTS